MWGLNKGEWVGLNIYIGITEKNILKSSKNHFTRKADTCVEASPSNVD